MVKTKVLIAIDEPKLAKKIVYIGCSFLDKENTEITLLNVIENNVEDKEYFLEAPQKYLEHEAEKSDFGYIENFLETEKFNYKGFIYKEGDVAKKILEVARNENFDLIILGSHNKNPLLRLFLGSVSYKVAMQSSASIIIVKPFYSPEVSPETKYSALLAVDSSDYSKNMSQNIINILDNKRAEIDILNVAIPIQELIPVDSYIYTDIDKIIEDIEAASKNLLREVTINVMKQKFNVNRKYHKEGDAGSIILSEAKNNDNQLIVLASHGKNSFSKWLIGSTSYKIYTHSERPVLIFKNKT